MPVNPLLSLACLIVALPASAHPAIVAHTCVPVEIRFQARMPHPDAFLKVRLDVAFTDPRGTTRTVPAFWSGGRQWTVRYSSSLTGKHRFRSACSATSDRGLHGVVGTIDMHPYVGANLLYRHGQVRVASDHRHFEHLDGAPFLWLADTWWKCLCKRMTWQAFQQLTADRRAKGFSVVQIVCGPYPDEGTFETRWENEGGKPYLVHDFSRVNPAYFTYADRRIRHLVESGIVPAIVGGWGRGDCDGMRLAGVEGMKRHWRHLIARYSAYPVVWIIGGESQGPEWTEVARSVRTTDPFHNPITIHPAQSGRLSVTDESVIDFDMLQTGHGDWAASRGAIPQLRTALGRMPAMPVLIGEHSYEGHMQTGFADQQRYVFWHSMLLGAAGQTYGAAGIWHAGVEGDPGLANVYDWTTWQQGMRYPGSTQLGLGKRLLESYPWPQFQPHPDWTDDRAIAAGIPGRMRMLYIPKRWVYDWNGPVVRGLERGVEYHSYYFDPVTGRRFDQGRVVNPGSANSPELRHTTPLLRDFGFPDGSHAEWLDRGSPTRVSNGRLIGGKGMLTTTDRVRAADVTVSTEANSDAEVGVVLRYQSPGRYLVALYSPLLKALYIHDRRDGAWGAMLGRVEVPSIGPRVHLVASARGSFAAASLSDGVRTYRTPTVRVTNRSDGPVGLWMYQIGDRQEFSEFQVSRSTLPAPANGRSEPATDMAWGGEYRVPNLPSPQDWVLVLEKTGAARR